MPETEKAQDQGRTLRDERLHELITFEYKHLNEQFVANEQMGEKRIALFVSLTAGLGAAAVLSREKLGGTPPLSYQELLLVVNVAWLLFGYLTFRRIVHRNVVTDRYKAQLRRLRTWFVKESDVEGRSLIPYDPYGPPDEVHGGLRFFSSKGGYAELAGLINAFTAGALGWQIGQYSVCCARLSPLGRKLIPVGIGIVLGCLAWVWQDTLAKRKYRE